MLECVPGTNRYWAMWVNSFVQGNNGSLWRGTKSCLIRHSRIMSWTTVPLLWLAFETLSTHNSLYGNLGVVQICCWDFVSNLVDTFTVLRSFLWNFLHIYMSVRCAIRIPQLSPFSKFWHPYRESLWPKLVLHFNAFNWSLLHMILIE